MNFVSYAQNFEDVMLLRALGDIREGFYIDVGAQDPIYDSVTNAFYQIGWRGVNVDPDPIFSEKLRSLRPGDINLEVAVSRSGNELIFFEIPDSGFSTCSKELAITHEELGHKIFERKVKSKTLNEIAAEYAKGPIHFLKLDVEGFEEEALLSLDLEIYRPWIILVEAIDAVNSTPSHQSWEPLILSKGYDFVYFDGLNRFYLAHEQRARKSHFESPPNPKDEYVKYSEWLLKQEVDWLRSVVEAKNNENTAIGEQLRQLQEQLAHSQSERRQATETLSVAKAELHSIMGSKTWRALEPVRFGDNCLRRVHWGLLKAISRIKYRLKGTSAPVSVARVPTEADNAPEPGCIPAGAAQIEKAIERATRSSRGKVQ